MDDFLKLDNFDEYLANKEPQDDFDEYLANEEPQNDIQELNFDDPRRGA